MSKITIYLTSLVGVYWFIARLSQVPTCLSGVSAISNPVNLLIKHSLKIDQLAF